MYPGSRETPDSLFLLRVPMRRAVILPGMIRIVQKRRYRKLDELIGKKAIGKKQFAQIRDYISVGPGRM